MTLSRASLATDTLVRSEANSITQSDPVQHFLQIINSSTKHKVAKIYYDDAADLPTVSTSMAGMVATVYNEFKHSVISDSLIQYQSTLELHLCNGSAWIKIFEHTGFHQAPNSVISGSQTTHLLLGMAT
jgi:hypothetical protein